MFKFGISIILQKKLEKLAKKDPVLVKNFRKKVEEIISHDIKSINTYKNLRHPKNKYKRIHLTKNIILIFEVFSKENKILFVNIAHRDNIYKEL